VTITLAWLLFPRKQDQLSFFFFLTKFIILVVASCSEFHKPCCIVIPSIESEQPLAQNSAAWLRLHVNLLSHKHSILDFHVLQWLFLQLQCWRVGV
jgi:hypothetical protein